MDMYNPSLGYGKVILEWYNQKGEYENEWIYEGGKWTDAQITIREELNDVCPCNGLSLSTEMR
jgi:hypothetical protein